MTDKQIVCVYLARVLARFIPDYEELRSIAAAEMTEARCERIANQIMAEAESMSEPLKRHLERCGLRLLPSEKRKHEGEATA